MVALRRLVLVVALLGGVLHLTKPSRDSFKRSIGSLVKREAGGGLAGWAAAKLTSAALHLSEAAGQHSFEDWVVAWVVRGTDELGDAEWLFVGVLSTWFAVHRRELGRFLVLRDPELEDAPASPRDE